MRRARSPCRNRGTVWITRVSTNQAAAFRPEWSFLHLFHMFGIDGFSRQNGGSFAVWHSAEDLFPIFLFPHHCVFSPKVQQQVSILPPASHQMLAHHFHHLLTLSIAKKLSVWQSNPTRPTT